MAAAARRSSSLRSVQNGRKPHVGTAERKTRRTRSRVEATLAVALDSLGDGVEQPTGMELSGEQDPPGDVRLEPWVFGTLA